jgi:hypothetical protein
VEVAYQFVSVSFIHYRQCRPSQSMYLIHNLFSATAVMKIIFLLHIIYNCKQ